jgi:CRP/FNR family transcriptional regulator, cyclic AMP receptor protein
MPTDVALLAEVPFFEFLNQEERATLAAQVEVVSFPAGRTLFNYGDPGDSLYVIRSGQVEIFVKDDTGERILLETAGRGAFFGELSLLDNGPRTASVLVTEDLEALRVDRGDLDQLLRQHPTAALDLLAAMGRRLRLTGNLLRHTASRNVNKEAEDTRTRVQKAADWIAEFSGSIAFLNLHLLFFFFWITLNVGWAERLSWMRSLSGFDPFPFGLLTMVVSLEAIVLSVFVLLSQNRQAVKDRIRSDVEYEVNLKAELEIAHLHEKLDHHTSRVLEHLASIERLVGRAAVGRNSG